jgi:hypothetical protein
VDVKDPRHAYAVLGVTPPVTQEHLKHRYKELVIRWHPDRFQSDPKAQAEAEIMMRNINVAYEVASAAPAYTEASQYATAGAAPTHAAPVTPPPHQPPERPFTLSREQVDAIVEQMNRSGRIDWPIEMSAERWLSLSVATFYMSVLGVAASFGMLRKGGMILALLYLPWPLCLIWRDLANKKNKSDLVRFYRLFGWIFLVGPPIVTVLYLGIVR